MVPALVELALDYYRNPVAYSHIADVSRPLPRGFSTMLTEFGTALSSARVEETAGLLSTDAHELEEAARFFARHVLLDPAGDYYRYLGLFRDATPESIRRHYMVLIRMFHPDRVKCANDADLAYSSRLNSAYHVLHDPAERARYDQGLPRSAWKRSSSDPRAFFLPRPAVIATPKAGRLYRMRSLLTVRRGLLLALGIAVVGMGYLFASRQTKPPLRLVGQEIASESSQMPYYLSGTSATHSTATPTSPNLEPAPAAASAYSPAAAFSVPTGAATDDATGITTGKARDADSDTTARIASSPTIPAKLRVAGESAGGFRSPIAPPAVSTSAPRPKPLVLPVGPSVSSVEPWRPAAERDDPALEHRSAQSAKVPERLSAKEQGLDQVTAPRTAAFSESSESVRASPPSAMSPKRSVAAQVPLAAGARMISRLELAYRRGDADAVAALFSKSARTSDGSGRNLIRSQYARLFRDLADQTLVITSMSWQPNGHSRLSGSGRFSVRTKTTASGTWKRSDGRIDIELVRAGTDFHFSSMLYRQD